MHQTKVSLVMKKKKQQQLQQQYKKKYTIQLKSKPYKI